MRKRLKTFLVHCIGFMLEFRFARFVTHAGVAERQTRWLQVPVGVTPVEVQILSPAPSIHTAFPQVKGLTRPTRERFFHQDSPLDYTCCRSATLVEKRYIISAISRLLTGKPVLTHARSIPTVPLAEATMSRATQAHMGNQGVSAAGADLL